MTLSGYRRARDLSYIFQRYADGSVQSQDLEEILATAHVTLKLRNMPTMVGDRRANTHVQSLAIHIRIIRLQLLTIY